MTDRIRVSTEAKPAGLLDRLLGKSSQRKCGTLRGYQPPSVKRTTVPLVRARYMIWIVVLVAGFGASKVYGTPHLLTTYSYWGPREWPVSSTCNYWGLNSQTIDVDGACPLFRLLTAKAVRHG